ncbi:BapA/Bap/LapF family large adhesin [Luteimonas terrae]|nr:BapA/Bap/LapF family large adhesin [Luteimonas terrae]
MAEIATVVAKSTGQASEVSTATPVVLDGASRVTLKVDPDAVATITRGVTGVDDLEVVLDDGSRIVIKDYFVNHAGELSELVLEDEDGGLWWLRPDPQTGGFMLAGDATTIPVASAVAASEEGALGVAAATGAGLSGSTLALAIGAGALAIGAAAAGGGGSSGGAPTPPTPPPADTTPPQPPTGQINGTGTTVTGTAEAGATVRVFSPGGVLLGSGVAAADGRYTITLNPAQTDGESLRVTATDAAGNVSNPTSVIAPDLTAPEAPTASISADGVTISGNAEPGATVTVYDTDGNPIAETVAGPDGAFTITLDPPLVAGESLTVTATDPAGNESPPASLFAPDTVAPAAPTAVINAAGDTVTGTAEAGSRVDITDAAGNVIGTAVAGTDGRYTITLSPALIAGETLTVTATDVAGNTSDPVTLIAPDLTDDIPPDAPTAFINATGTELSGVAERGATVTVYDANNAVVGTTVAGSDGRYVFALDPPRIAGETFTVSATDAAGNESPRTPVDAPDLSDNIPPDAPTAFINGAGDTVSGTAEVGATVNVYDSTGALIGSGVARTDGRYTISLEPPRTAGEALIVNATDAAGNTSPDVPLTAPVLDTTPPAPPLAVINADGDTVSGTAEPGSTVRVYDANGTVIGEGPAGTDGRFSIVLNTPLTSGELLTVTATDASNNESDPTSLTAPDATDNTPPDSPTAFINGAGDTVTGIAEVGSTVQVFDPQNVLLGTGVAGTDGRYTITLVPPQTGGETLSVIATDAADNPSVPTQLVAPDLSVADVPPAPDATINDAGDTVSGTADAGTTVRLYDASGALLDEVVAVDGSFTFTLSPPLTAGERLSVTASNGVGESFPTTLFAPDLTDVEPPAPPVAVINAEGDTVNGSTEAGARVEVRAADGTLLGSGFAGTDGRFEITLTPPQTAGQELFVRAFDAANNESGPTSLVAPDLSDVTPPAPPTAVINDTGDVVSGLTEPGATVRVLSPLGAPLGEAIAGADGRYAINLTPPQTAGEQLTVIATDAAGNDSGATLLTAPDLTDTTAPDAPTAVINGAGDLVSGQAEIGARVEVRADNGTVLGSGVAGTEGRYAIVLDPAVTGGETLFVVAIDAANNASLPTTVLAPDLTDDIPPEAPTAVINDAGDTVTGIAEAGSRVDVRTLDGALLGSAVAGTDGRYTVGLTPPQTAGEVLWVTATDAANNTSPPTPATAPDLTDDVAPPAPTAEITDAGDGVSGTAEVGATVRITVGGVVVGSAVAGTDGLYTIALSPPLTNGEALSVTATDAAGNTSLPTVINAPVIVDDEPPAPPTATISVDGATVTGSAEAGATVRVLDPDGQQIGQAVANADGSYSITLDPPRIAGETLSVTATDAAGNVSDPTPLVAPDAIAPDAPTATFSPDGVTVTGVAEAGSTVRIYDAARNVIGTATAGTDGSYTITFDPPLTSGEQLAVTATDASNNESPATALTAPNLGDVDNPEPPTASITPSGDEVSGLAEAGSTVIVRNANTGAELGRTTATPEGTYAIGFDPPLTNGENLIVTATDAAGNVSDGTPLTAPNLADSVIAYDDVALASLDLIPTTTDVSLGSANYVALVGLGLLNLRATVLGTPSVGFTVGEGKSLDAVFDYGAVLSAGVLGDYRVVVQRWDGSQWSAINGPGAATLLELNLLTGTASAQLDNLGPGQYRAFMTFNGVGVGLLGALSVGGVESDFTVLADIEGQAATGNVMDADVSTDNTVVSLVNNQAIAAGGTTIVGQYGVLIIDSDGNYTYTPTESAANIGQVDQFTYTLVDTVTGATSTATLYVRIGSPDVPLVWDDADPGAPATFDFAVNGDTASAGVEFANVTRDVFDATHGIQLVGLLSTQNWFSNTFTVGANVDITGTASLNSLVSLLSSGSLSLQQQNAQGAWVNVAGGTVSYSLLLGLVGPVATLDLSTLDLAPGTYRFRATVSGAGGVGVGVNIDVNGTFLDEYRVVDTDDAVGNLLANDVTGSGFTQLRILDLESGAYLDVDANVPRTIQGQYGELRIDAGGNYVYTPDDASAFFGQPVTETFTYQLVHPTGQVGTGTLVVTVQPDGAGIQATAEAFDLDAITGEDAGAEAHGDGGLDFDVQQFFDASGHVTPLMVRGEGDQVIALDAPRFGDHAANAAAWEVDYGVPLRQEDDTDALLSQQSVSAL